MRGRRDTSGGLFHLLAIFLVLPLPPPLLLSAVEGKRWPSPRVDVTDTHAFNSVPSPLSLMDAYIHARRRAGRQDLYMSEPLSDTFSHYGGEVGLDAPLRPDAFGIYTYERRNDSDVASRRRLQPRRLALALSSPLLLSWGARR